MSQPRLEVFMFEYFLNTAVAAYLLAGGIDKLPKQTDNEGLVTPRVEIKTVFGGWGPSVTAPHVWINQTGEKFPDCRDAKLYIKAITRRGDNTQDHDKLMGRVRGLMLTGRALISGRMTWHTINHLLELGTVPDFNQVQNQDVSTLSFDVRLSILYPTKPEIFQG